MNTNLSQLMSMLSTVYSPIAVITDRHGVIESYNMEDATKQNYKKILREQKKFINLCDTPGYHVDSMGFTWAVFPLPSDHKTLVIGPISVMSFYVRFNTLQNIEDVTIPALSWDVFKLLLKTIAYLLYDTDLNIEPSSEQKEFDGIMSAQEYYDTHTDVSAKIDCAVRFLQFAIDCIKQGNKDDLYMLIMDDAFAGFISMLLGISREKTPLYFAFVAAQCTAAASDYEISVEPVKIYVKYMEKINKAHSPVEIIHILRNMLLEFVDHTRKKQEIIGKSSKVRDALQFINANIENDFSAAEIADHIHISQSHLLRLFKNEYGITLNDYIKKKKLERACLYLKFYDYSIVDISHKLSFCNQSYFSSCFKKEYGISPMEYRKQTSCCITNTQ